MSSYNRMRKHEAKVSRAQRAMKTVVFEITLACGCKSTLSTWCEKENVQKNIEMQRAHATERFCRDHQPQAVSQVIG
jgi:hypothetical protein